MKRDTEYRPIPRVSPCTPCETTVSSQPSLCSFLEREEDFPCRGKEGETPAAYVKPGRQGTAEEGHSSLLVCRRRLDVRFQKILHPDDRAITVLFDLDAWHQALAEMRAGGIEQARRAPAIKGEDHM